MGLGDIIKKAEEAVESVAGDLAGKAESEVGEVLSGQKSVEGAKQDMEQQAEQSVQGQASSLGVPGVGQPTDPSQGQPAPDPNQGQPAPDPNQGQPAPDPNQGQ